MPPRSDEDVMVRQANHEGRNFSRGPELPRTVPAIAPGPR